MSKENPILRRARQSRWQRSVYAEMRASLIERLGGRCAICGSTERLEFDHWPWPAAVNLAGLGRVQRMRHYQVEADMGCLRILCRRCNAADGGKREWISVQERAIAAAINNGEGG